MRRQSNLRAIDDEAQMKRGVSLSKKAFYLLGAAIAVLGMAAFFHTLYLYTHRQFGIKDFSHPFILREERNILLTQADQEEVRQALSQRFTYLNYGGQMTAYVSCDQRFVIKFFNPRSVIKEEWFHRLRKLRYINSPQWILRTHFRKKEKLRKQFDRYAAAFRDLREETGLIYAHLGSSSCLSQEVEIIDKEGVSHTINLNLYPFVLQKRAELTMDYLKRQIETGDLEAAQKGVRSIYDLFLARTSKGYKDRFQAIDKNYGFVEGKAVQFDVGRIEQVNAIRQRPCQEMAKIISHILPILESFFPNLVSVLIDSFQADQSSTCTIEPLKRTLHSNST